jgi:ABC-type amino acid transport substrate-binding protein
MVFRFFVFIAIVLWSGQLSARTIVNVGLTSIQPPLVFSGSEERGLIYDVLAALNDHQDDFTFTPSLVPAKRLLANHQTDDFHLIAYNDVLWGWAQRGGKPSVNLTNGKDLFFQLKGTNQTNGITAQIGAVMGFHYAFSNFDAEKLGSMPNVSLVSDESGVLKLVEYGRVDKGIASETFLNWVSVSEPEVYAKLQIFAEQPDHTYNRQFVVFPYAPITVEQLNIYLRGLKASGVLGEIYAKYGIEIPDF